MAHVIDAILTLKDHFSAQLQNVSRNLSAFQKKANYLSKSINRTGKSFTKAGATLTKGLTLPIGAMAIASGKAAIDFESAFAGVKKTVNATNEELEKIKKGIIDMSKVMPESASDIAKVAESAGQLGIQTDNILDFTKTMVMLGDATNLSSDEAATSLARFANITQMSQDKFSNLGSTIVALGNNMATTESEITEMALRIAGAGHQVGLTQSQMMGFSAAMSSVGIQAEAGGSAFSKTISDMSLAVQTGNKQLGKFAKIAGMSGKEFQKAFKTDASGAIVSFIHGLSEAKKHGTSAIKMLDDAGITELRARDTLLRLAGAGDLVSKSLGISNEAWKENTALQNEANQRYATTLSKLKMLKNKLVDLGIKIGGFLLPTIQRFTDKLGNLVDKFSNLSPHTQQAIIKFGMIAASIGPALWAIGKLTKGVSKSINKFVKLGKAIKRAGGVMAFLSTPGMIVAGVITLLVVGAILLVTHWKQVTNCFKWVAKQLSSVINIFKRFASIISSRVVKAFTNLVSKVKPALSQFISAIKQAFNLIKPIIMPVLAFLSGVFVSGIMAVFSEISTIISTAISVIGGILTGLINILTGVINFVTGVFTGNWSQCWSSVQTIVSGACSIISSLWEGIISLLSAPVQAIVDILDSAFHDKIAKIKSAWEGIKTFLSHPIQGIVSLVQHGDLSGVGKNALGTPYWHGGYTVVGEHGPEVVELPKGSRVNDANTSNKMFNQGGSNINISISNMNVRQESDIDSIANALASRIHLEMLNMA